MEVLKFKNSRMRISRKMDLSEFFAKIKILTMEDYQEEQEFLISPNFFTNIIKKKPNPWL